MAAEGHRAHMQAQKAPSSSANRLAESLTANSHSSEEEGDSDGGVQLLLSHLHLEARPEVTMAARNRPRGGLTKDDPADAHEERNMWNQIVNDVNLRLKPLHARSTEVMKMIVEMESRIDSISCSVKEIDELAALYREGLKLCEEEQKILNEEPNDVIKNVGILTALRTASEIEPPRTQAPPKPRTVKRKIDTDGAADSPGPSPSVATSASRLKGSSVRSGSVPLSRDGKEASVKVEEGSEGSKGPSAERAGKFFVGAEVAYKQTKMKEDGSQWIQCNIISMVDIGNKKRYEVQDPEPDSESGAPGQIYKTAATALIAIPSPDAILPEYPVGKHVLARYPETTTFYRAEVTGIKRDMYRLKFEDDQNQEMDVDRRFVLDVSSK